MDNLLSNLDLCVLIFPAYGKQQTFEIRHVQIDEGMIVDWAAHHVVSWISNSQIILTNQNESNIFYNLIVLENLEFGKPCRE